MKRDEPIVITLQPFSRDMAVKGLSFFESLLGPTSTISHRHPLRRTYEEAAKHLSSGFTWGPSREFNMLALWGIQLWMVRDWPGFEGLTRRIKTELQNWDAHLHEAVVASMFWLGGCDGEFLNPGTQGGPDLRISYASREALVECKRSKALTQQEQKNWRIWHPTTSQIVYYLWEQVPSALVRFYPMRDAVVQDAELLVDDVKQKIASWKEYHAKNPLKHWGYGDLQASDGSFTGRVIVSHDPNESFDAAAEGHPGIEVPGETEPVSLILDLTPSDPPTCDGLWYAKVHTKRVWSNVEKAVLTRLDRKASQLNSYRQSSSPGIVLPGVIWIHHPALRDAGYEDLERLGKRISGKFAHDKWGHFGAVAAVMLADSRLLLGKYGQLAPQYRFFFVSNPYAQPSLYEEFPYVSWSWWDEAESYGLPARDVFDKRVWLGSQGTQLKTDP